MKTRDIVSICPECGCEFADHFNDVCPGTNKEARIYNCLDIGDGVPCGNYPARTGDDCTFCNGQPKVVNPVIAQLKRELAEARTDEIMAIQLGHNTERWTGYILALRRAIEIVEKGA